jgi:prephenate dehydratase
VEIHYLGPAGSFSEQAAKKFAARLGIDPILRSEPTFEAVARSTESEGLGILPYYNFLEGLIQETLDLTYEHRLAIVSAVRVPVQFALGTSTVEAERDEIVSHPKALAQCSDYLSRELPSARLTPVASTSEAARLASLTSRLYAVSSVQALQNNNLRVVAADIGNLRHGKCNFTDFFVVGGVDFVDDTHVPANDLTMVAITPPHDKPGLLAEILTQVGFFGLNVTRIHSRPALEERSGSGEPQMFYLEVVSAPRNEPLRRCLEDLDYKFSLVNGHAVSRPTRILGSFALRD